MQTSDSLIERWRYLRDLLVAQLDRFEQGMLSLRANEIDVSADAIASVKQQIKAFDDLIAGEAGIAVSVGKAKRAARSVVPPYGSRMRH